MEGRDRVAQTLVRQLLAGQKRFILRGREVEQTSLSWCLGPHPAAYS